MKISEGWLKEHWDTAASSENISDVLTHMGLEVESFDPPRADLLAFESAHILEARPHPHAQKLQVCQVRTGQGHTLTIVCGASNARTGLKVVLAPLGSVIPTSGLSIQHTEIRGVSSQGMLCSAKELGVGAEAEGIIELPADTPLGVSYATLCGFDEGIWDINITPNRGDCLSVRGIARDLAAQGLGQLRPLEEIRRGYTASAHAHLRGPSPLPQECPVFMCRHIQGIRPCASPAWLKRRLTQVGLKSISPVVDILQWVMWDIGHPMHAYDAQKLAGDIQVRHAQPGETLEGLNGKTYALIPQDVVIADSEKVVALAGILGSLDTACSESTTHVCLEAAVFAPESIARTGQRLMLSTDARARFERGVDAAQVIHALNEATHWILELCGGEASEISTWSSLKDMAPPEPIRFSLAQFQRLTGVEDMTLEIATPLLQGLGCTTHQAHPSSLDVTPPSWRHDLKIPEDLVEEVLRLSGYDTVPKVLPIPNAGWASSDDRAEALNRLRQVLTHQGYSEVVNWSFIHDQQAQRLGIEPCVRIDNPISQDLNVLRPSLIPQLLDQVRSNQAHGLSSVALFEMGPTYQGLRPEDQKICVAGVRTGSQGVPHWRQASQSYDVFEMKADVWRVIEAWGFNSDRLQVVASSTPSYYHPGRSATLQQGPKKILGTWGELHPHQHKLWDLKTPVMIFELWMDAWAVVAPQSFRASWHPSPYPVVERDFAFILEAHVPMADVLRQITQTHPAIIRSVRLFDIYEDASWEGKRRSYAFRVSLQSDTQTLTDAQIHEISERIIHTITQTYSATLRNG